MYRALSKVALRVSDVFRAPRRALAHALQAGAAEGRGFGHEVTFRVSCVIYTEWCSGRIKCIECVGVRQLSDKGWAFSSQTLGSEVRSICSVYCLYKPGQGLGILAAATDKQRWTAFAFLICCKELCHI